MRLKHWSWALPVALVSLVGCGSAPSLLNSPGAPDERVMVQAASTRPSISISRPTLSVRKLAAEGGPVFVGALVTLKNLAPGQVTVVANATDSKRKVVAMQPMTLGEGNAWRTGEPGLALQPNFAKKAVSYTVNVVVTTTSAPTLKKTLKAGTVSVAKNSSDPNQPPPPPAF